MSIPGAQLKRSVTQIQLPLLNIVVVQLDLLTHPFCYVLDHLFSILHNGYS